ncbi:MAG: hypothetical protein Kow0042_06130 [Calditrichia bacterium]
MNSVNFKIWEPIMDKEKLEEFKKLLLEKRQEVLKRKEHLLDISQETSGEVSFGSGESFSLDDQGSESDEREKLFLLLSRENKYLQQIDRSLTAIDLGEYGICRVCGKEISEERLRAVPTTRICVPCKQKEERRR